MEKTYTFKPGSRYITRGIGSAVPIEIQIFLWSLVDELVAKSEQCDYLQVFKIIRNDEKTLMVTHETEEPEYRKTHQIICKPQYESLIGETIYIIDDIDHSTMLFASEY